ncbi:MAG: hypothetical protein KDA22_10315 [Phycisphaerales bacterium]|nr:hypothetical protein [Phycisphaerales bacterium]
MRRHRGANRRLRAAALTAVALHLLGEGCATTSSSTAAVQAERDRAVQQAIAVQTQVMALADAYAEAYFRIVFDVSKLPDPGPRGLIAARVLGAMGTASVFELASQSDPGRSLIDLMVFVRLQRNLLRSGDQSWASPAAIEVFLSNIDRMDERIWSEGERQLAPAQLDLLKRVIAQYREQNRERLFLGFMRVGVEDLEQLGLESIYTDASAAGDGGLFAPVDRATEEIRQTRLLAERALFVVQRLPIVASRFAQVAAATMLDSPEMSRRLEPIVGLGRSLDRTSSQLDRLATVAESAEERVDAVLKSSESSVGRLLDRAERILAVADPMTERLVEATGRLDGALERADPTLASATETLRRADAVVGELRGLLGSSELASSLASGQSVAASADATAERLAAILDRVEKLLGPLSGGKDTSDLPTAIDERIAVADRHLRDLIDYALWRAIAATVVVTLVVVAGVVAVRRLGR